MNKRKLWIWENENYPNFVYDKKEIGKLLLDIAKQQELLEGTIKYLSQDEKNIIFTENLLDSGSNAKRRKYLIYKWSVSNKLY